MDKNELYAKSGLRRRVLGPAMGDGILVSDGHVWKGKRLCVGCAAIRNGPREYSEYRREYSEYGRAY